MNTRLFLFPAAALLAASCAATGGRGDAGAGKPPAVQRLSVGLAPERYLSAVGFGDTRAQAEKAAASELAKVFESRVRVEDSLVERYTELMSSKGASVSGQTDINRQTTITSAQTLYNLKYTESSVDAKGIVAVVAYMDRRETATVYLDKIGVNSGRVKFLEGEAGKTDDPVRHFALLGAAATIGVNNGILVDQLSIISQPAHKSVQLGYDLSSLQKQAADAAKKVGFAVRIKGDPDNRVSKLCEELFTDMGFVVSDKPVLTVDGTFTIEDTDLGRTDAKFVRYDCTLSVRDGSGTSFATLVEKGREGHASTKEASARVLRTIKEKLQTELRRKLTAYFDSLTRREG